MTLNAWISALPELKARLIDGIDVADVGCGRGCAIIELAEAFPRSRFAGYDVHGPSVHEAEVAAKEAGVDARVRFREHDAAIGLPERYDLVTTNGVCNVTDPTGVLHAIRASLHADGIYLHLDARCSHLHERQLTELAKEAGFASVRKIEIDDPVNNLYEIRP